MRTAMATAAVDDDVIDKDPTVERLETLTAEILGKEAALFMPSGTMTNQIAVRLHCKPGEEFLCEAGCHIYNYEQGAFAQLSGVVARTVIGHDNILQTDDVAGLIRPENEHLVRTKMICLENTHNRGGGRILPYDSVAEVCQWARNHQLSTHLDGARLFNAVMGSNISASDWAQHFDTVSVCFSKGLGAPVGSALAGTKEAMYEAHRHRKLFGGAMRQSGIIAAGALYALEHNIERIAEDHTNAQIIATAIRQADGLSLATNDVDSNIIIFDIDPDVCDASGFVGAMAEEGVLLIGLGPQTMRIVTHLDVSQEDCQTAAGTLLRTVSELADGSRKPVQSGAVY